MAPARVATAVAGGGAWLRALRAYLAATAVGSLAWEVAHMPLYTLWREGTPGEIAFAILHCAGGDVLIALAALALALVTVGRGTWPAAGHGRVAAVAITAGVAYTVFSEWLNVAVRRSWAYAEAMPTLPLPGGFALGLSPLLQWLVVPAVAFWLTRRRALRSRHGGGGGDAPPSRLEGAGDNRV